MKKILGIKWELIIAILLLITTITSWSLWEDIKDWRITILMIIPLIAFVLWIVCYDKIRSFRKQVYKMW